MGRLILTLRPRSESVVVATRGTDGKLTEKLQIELSEIRGGQVKLAFVADPSEVRVHRSKIWDRIRAQGGRERSRRKPDDDDRDAA